MKIRTQLLLAAGFFAGCTGLRAQFVWTGSGATGSVTDPNNWQAHTPAVPVGDGSEDLAFPTLVGTQSTVLFPTMAVNNVSFTSSLSFYDFSGSGSPVLTINGNISGAAGSDVTFENTLGVSFSTGSHTIDTQSSASLQIDSILSGNGALTFTGSGTANLGNNNTYAGGTIVDQGGHVSLSGSITHTGSDTLVGFSSGSNAELDINAGAHVTDSTGQIGFADNTTSGTVYVDGAGATWTNIADLNVGPSGNGTLFIHNGGAVNSANTFLAANAGSTGFVEISSASTMNNSGTLSVGGLGNATLDIIQGSVATNVTGLIANNVGGFGSVDVNGPGSTWNNTGDLHVGVAGTAVLTVENGSLVHSANGYVATQSTASGDVLVTDPGSLWNVSNALYIGYGGNGVLGLYAGGTVAVAGGNGTIFLGFNSGATGELVIGQGVGDGGTVNATTITTMAGTGAVTFYNDDTNANPYHLTKDGTGFGTPVNITGPTTVFSQGGYTVLSGSNTYTGGTTIVDGTMVATTSNAFGSGPITLASPTATVGVISGKALANTLNLVNGGTLIGTGSFGSSITLGLNTTVSPGFGGIFDNGIGDLLFSQGLTLANGGTYSFQVLHASGALQGTDFDTIQLTGGVLNVAGSQFTIKLQSVDSSGNPAALTDFVSTSAYSWILFSSPAGITNFSPADFTIDTSGFANSLGAGSFFVVQSGNSIDLDFSPVPEPSTYALLASGLAVVGWTLRRRLRPSAVR